MRGSLDRKEYFNGLVNFSKKAEQMPNENHSISIVGMSAISAVLFTEAGSMCGLDRSVSMLIGVAIFCGGPLPFISFKTFFQSMQSRLITLELRKIYFGKYGLLSLRWLF